ncbi:MAG: T9SS type A sorting domain-containing protein [Bacteroidales bacterium]|nr:T9SS type A sorting domain-containing protein [Bacteroidales bacterium]
MKNLILLLIAFTFTICNVHAQTEPDWTRVLQASTYNYPTGRVVTADADNIYSATNISGPVTFENITYTSIGLTDMIVFKFTDTGDVTWAKQFNAQATGSIIPSAMQVDANQCLYVVGTFSGSANFGSNTITSDATNNSFLTKLDPGGNVKWAKAFAATGTGSSKIVFDADSNIYLLNKTASLIKFDISGNKIWEQNYPDRTLQAIAVYEQYLFLGGALQKGTTTFGKYDLTSSGDYNTGFIAKANLDGSYGQTLVLEDGSLPLSTKDGNYNAVGTFIHPTAGTRTYNLTKTLIGSEENVLTTSIGDLGGAGLLLTINPDNTVTVSSSDVSPIIFESGVNIYDPVNQTFTLNYSYSGTTGNRVISEVLTKSATPIAATDGSSVSDFLIDKSGNLIITGGYTKNLTLGTINVNNTNSSHFTYIAKCNSNFEFVWVKSSNEISTREMYTYRLFQDGSDNLYQYGLSSYSVSDFTYGLVSVAQQPQFLFKFDANGEVISGRGLQNTFTDRIVVTPLGKIAVTRGNLVSSGELQSGNFLVGQYSNDDSFEWVKYSTAHQAGSISINYVKHDNLENTYAQARIQGYCNFFGTIINSNNETTVNAKFDRKGHLSWINQINDLAPFLIYGPEFSLDKDNNLLAVGKFATSVTIGTQTLTNANTAEDGYIVKYAPNGQILWATQLAAEGALQIMGIASDKDGHVIVSGEFEYALTIGNKTIDASSAQGAFILKLDATGNCLWANGYPQQIVYSAMPACDENNNIYMTGEMYNFSTNQLVFGTLTIPQTNDDGGTVLAKFNPDGVPQWAYTYGGVAGASYIQGWPGDIKTDAAGNTYLSGWCANNANFGSTLLTNPLSNSTLSFYISKINTDGGVVWAEGIHNKTPSYPYGDLLDLDKNGNVYIGGHFRDAISVQGNTYNPIGTYDFFVTKYSNDGVFQWIKTMPSNSDITAMSVYNVDVLSICGNAGIEPTLGNFTIDRKGASTCIIATLGMLEPLPNTLFVDFTEGSETSYTFSSTANWTVTSNQEWLTISSSEGSGNGTLIFTAAENTTGEPRTATVTITFKDTKTQSITLTIIQDAGTTDITDLQKNKQLVYPNPATTFLHLNSEVHNALISIYDSKGKMAVNKQVNTPEINISNLRNGIYTIRISNKSGIKTQKFVKQ